MLAEERALSQHGERETDPFPVRAGGRRCVPGGGCQRGGGRERRGAAERGAAGGGSATGGPRLGKTHILKPEGFREHVWEVPWVPLERPRPAYGIGERAPGHRSLFGTVNLVCKARG